jgi:hypothetical protein
MNKKLGDKPVSGYGYATENMSRENSGMTLREYYAGLFMQGLLSNPEIVKERGGLTSGEAIFYAEWAIEMTNTFLEELSKEEKI